MAGKITRLLGTQTPINKNTKCGRKTPTRGCEFECCAPAVSTIGRGGKASLTPIQIDSGRHGGIVWCSSRPFLFLFFGKTGYFRLSCTLLPPWHIAVRSPPLFSRQKSLPLRVTTISLPFLTGVRTTVSNIFVATA